MRPFISVDVCQLSFFSFLITTLNNEDDEYRTVRSNINRSVRCTEENEVLNTRERERKKMKFTILVDPLQHAITSASPFFTTSCVLRVIVGVKQYDILDEQLFSTSQQPNKIRYVFYIFLFECFIMKMRMCLCEGMSIKKRNETNKNKYKYISEYNHKIIRVMK